jgi:hypothetical protein
LPEWLPLRLPLAPPGPGRAAGLEGPKFRFALLFLEVQAVSDAT